jgi:hypothetical protein
MVVFNMTILHTFQLVNPIHGLNHRHLFNTNIVSSIFRPTYTPSHRTNSMYEHNATSHPLS